MCDAGCDETKGIAPPTAYVRRRRQQLVHQHYFEGLAERQGQDAHSCVDAVFRRTKSTRQTERVMA